ncbi:DUF1754-domain-containing protein [Annulohypoxylon truncatum]|uniref:DUF1754-domain-containing protein n=1 Tax=Annulohypoxylon truncatum TaxID=327061 RepID=UPI0020088022|nr:DUF1754-domain-containing protein [Annulohypoxylon truncatum]KAI1214513.1 DUF1754-domain-containing protein [Annulohypoxylon truncatum]
MPADDYAPVGGGGALKLKGGKVQKNKKKNKTKANLEHSLAVEHSTTKEGKEAKEVDKKRQDDGDDVDIIEHKTEAERRHEEANRKKMLKMLEDPKVASEFRKTHKERVEGLNTYLSKLSEHHDMPKIGPG